MQSFFSPSTLESARVLVLNGESVGNPPFYAALVQMGFEPAALPNFSLMAAITFVDTVVSHEPFNERLLFQELVHVVQYEKLSLEGFAAKYVRGFLIVVPQQVTRELVKGECLPQLLSSPLRGWVGGHIGVQNATPVMSQLEEHVKDLEADRGHREEVDGDQLLSMILQKCAPSLRRRIAAAHHVFADAAFTDVDAELEQLTVDPWCTPKWILSAHFDDQISHLTGNDRSSRLAMPHLPGPEQAKAGTMPGNDCFRLDDGNRRAPIAPEAGQTDPQQAVPRGQFRAFCSGPLKHADLVAQSQILQRSAARERKIDHRVARSVVREMGIDENYEGNISSIPSDISRFSRGTIVATVLRRCANAFCALGSLYWYSSAVAMGAAPPVTRTLPSWSNVAVCQTRGEIMLPVIAKVPAVGS
jgi:hypothetical protein